MGFYFRKSINIGALRFNISKSGVGLSTGVKGFRIGTGPRGNFIHAGANGFYYKKTFGNTNQIAPSSKTQNSSAIPEYNFKEIESGKVEFMVDSSFDEILSEINEKSSKISFLPIAIVVSGLLALVNPVCLILFPVTIPVAMVMNKKRKTIYLVYNIEEEMEATLQRFYNAFESLIGSSKKWHIGSEAGLSSDYEKKINAGATSLVKRSQTLINFGLPKYMVSNIKIPVIAVGKQTLYFLPERILIKDGKKYGTINYQELEIEFGNSQFIESEGVPNDSEVVGRTWKYVNKKGGPDKRFKDNVELPIMKYSQIHFKSRSGLNELIQVSKPNLGKEIFEAMKSKC